MLTMSQIEPDETGREGAPAEGYHADTEGEEIRSSPGEGEEQFKRLAKGEYAKSGEPEFDIVGYPVYNVKWDELGIGPAPMMGYLPGRAVHIQVKGGKWRITGPRTSSSILLFIALGAGGAIYFLEDVIRQIKNWGEIVGGLIILIPTLINLAVRVRTLELYPFELDLVGYDKESGLLVLSTVTEPGGLVALKVEYSSNEDMRKYEEEKLIADLKRSHTGFMLLESYSSQGDNTRVKQWSLWTLVWGLIFLVMILTRRFIR